MIQRLLSPRGIHPRRLIAQTFRSYFHTSGPTTAAAVAYFTLICLFPAFLLLVALTDKFLKIHGISRELAEGIITLFPTGTRQFILTNLDTMIAAPSWGSIITYASIFLWAGLWVFHIIAEAMDKAWRVECRRPFWRATLTHLGIIVLSSVSVLGSTLLVATIRILRSRLLPPDLIWGKWFFQLLLSAVAYLLIVAVLALIYKIIPNTRVRFWEAFSGGLVAAALWHVANAIFVWTIPFIHYQDVYGSVWALVVIVVWIYVSCWIMLIGAHLTYHIHRYAEPSATDPPTGPLRLP